MKSLLFVAVLVLWPTVDLTAQGPVTPTSHWGGNILPELEDRIDWGLHFVGFTRYGKEVLPGASNDPTDGAYTFTPYNDLRHTLGFNVVTRSASSHVGHLSSTQNTLRGRRTFSVGAMSDVLPEFFQNRFAHWGNLKKDKLRYVPRRLTDTPAADPEPAKNEVFPVILGFSDEYFLYITAGRRQEDPSDGIVWEERIRTPFFVGGGYALSTINQELFLHAGSDVLEHHFSRRCLFGEACLRSAGVGAVARAGVLLPGFQLRDLTPYFVNLQGVSGATVTLGSYPVRLEAAATSATGFFVRPRTDEEWQIISERLNTTNRVKMEEGAWAVYPSKRPVHELFFSGRLRIGRMTFEYLNDSVSGKDKGPSFAVSATFKFALARDFETVGGAQ